MQLYYQIIEQLHLAAEQLHKNGPNFARFAMILIDNAIELMVHCKAKNIVMWDEIIADINPPRFDPTLRKEAKGQTLRPKVELCVSDGVLRRDERDWVLICHKYRNTLYHQGIAYEDFCFDLAWHYYGVACELLPRFAGQVWCGSDDVISDIVKQYTSEDGLRIGDSEAHLTEVAHSLLTARPKKCRQLSEALSVASVERIGRVIASLEFLARDNPAHFGKQQIIEETQFTDYIRGLTLPKLTTIEEYKTYIAARRSNWQPTFARNPLPAWLRRAKSIQNAKSPIRALRRFDRLLRESRWFEQLISGAASELDAYIDHQINVARGK